VNTRKYIKLFRDSAHPSDEELMQFLDGETDGKRATEVKEHLAVCWACRARREEIEQTIFAFIKNRQAALSDSLELPPPAQSQFQLRARRLLAESGKPSLLARWRGTLATWLSDWQIEPPVRIRVATGLVCLCVLLVIGILMSRGSSVSARELLERSAQAEAARLSQVAEPVVYRKIQVRRRSSSAVAAAEESVTWESWNEARGVSGGRFRQRVADGHGLRFIHTDERADEQSAPAIITELEQIFRANHLDPRRPLSAAVHAGWRGSVRRQPETVTEVALPGGEMGLRLTTVADGPFAASAIVEASLVVRRRDWHAVAQQLRVQGEREVREYELSETAYEVLPLQALTVFADLAPTPAATVLPAASPTPVAVAASPSPAPKALPTEAALKDAEVAAAYALHQAQADLGEQIEIVRDPMGQPAGQPAGQIVVRGLVETEERKQRLTEALRGIPLVAAQIQTVEEAARQAAATPSSRAARGAPVSEPVIPVTPGTNAFEQRLARYFAERETSPKNDAQRNINLKIAQLSNQVFSESSAAFSEAWALRRLIERFAAEKENELPPAARQRIEEMTANHIARLKTQSRHLRERLEPILVSIAGGKIPAVSGPAPSESTAEARALLLFRAVEQAQQITDRLFAGTGSTATPEEAARQLLAALDRLDHTLLSFEQAITR